MAALLEAAITRFLAIDSPSLVSVPEVVTHDGDDVDIEAVRTLLQQYDSMVTGDGAVLLPLHEADSATLTGEYLEYHGTGLAPTYVYRDAESGSRARLDPGRVGETELGWQLRFWTDAFDPPETPSYGDDDADLEAVRAEPTATMDPEEQDALHDELVTFVEGMRERDREDSRERLRERGYRHVCATEGGIREVIYSGRRVTQDHGTVIEFEVPADEGDRDRISIPSKFDLYPDSEVLVTLNPDASPHFDREDVPFPIEARIAEVSNRTLSIAPIEGRTPGHERLKRYLDHERAVFTVLPLVNNVPYDRERDAIETIRGDERKWDVVTGQRPLEFGPAFTVDLDVDLPLNEFQEEAATRALRARDVYCIHGPPGTGKTRTLLAIIEQAVADGLRVLACAHSNQAVDNLLVGSSALDNPDEGSLHALALDESDESLDVDLRRVGHTESDVIERHYTDGSVDSADVVGATTSMASRFDPGTFDLAVVDEATQASIPATMLPWACADRLVLAGDHKQLPPFGSDDIPLSRSTVNDGEDGWFFSFIRTSSARGQTTRARLLVALAAFQPRRHVDSSIWTGPTRSS